MFILLTIGACGAWCAHQHWMRLAQEGSIWRHSFWWWVLRGFAFPAAVWALANFGFGDRFPPLVPLLADAQAAKQPWVGRWINVSLAGGILVLTFWAAVSYLWILGRMFGQSPKRAELAFNVAVFGFFSGACGAALAYTHGLQYFGAAVVITLLPVVYLTLELAEEPPPRPVYDRAIGQINFGKYEAAEWELISQLEKREDDFQGWMMLAELYARQHQSMEEAARVILDVCQHPNTQPGEISLACHKLADWQLEIAGNPEGAKAALALLIRKLPGTHFAHMAEQRIKQLPRDAVEFEQLKTPKRINLPALREDSEELTIKKGRFEAATDANRLSQLLTDNPNDFATREKLAYSLAVDLGKVELGIEQLRLLIDFPDSSDRQKAKWLAQIAAWELKLKGNETRYIELLREIIGKYPQSAEAFAAQRQLFLHGQDHPAPATA